MPIRIIVGPLFNQRRFYNSAQIAGYDGWPIFIRSGLFGKKLMMKNLKIVWKMEELKTFVFNTLFIFYKGGILTLTKSTLSKLSIYFLSLFLLLASVASCIEKIFCNFYWRGTGDKTKFHLVGWDKVCSLIPCGRGVKRQLVNQ